jgi:hypothetical protein
MIDVKKQLYINARLAGKNQEQAGIIAGSKTIVGARAYATRMSKDVEVQEQLQNTLDVQIIKHRLTLDRALERLSDGLDAIKIDLKTGITQVDHATRLSSARDVLKLLSSLPAKTPDKTLDSAVDDLLVDTDEIDLQNKILNKTPDIKP